MYLKKFVNFFFILLFFLTTTLFIYFKFFKIDKNVTTEERSNKEINNSNLIENVEYTTKDKDGNEYLIRAKEGEIDLSNSNIIYLKKVFAFIKLVDSEEVTIISDFGKYNSENHNTIFSKNVIIKYLDNNITGEYMDFSLERNSILISKNVNYSNLENELKADVVDIDIKTKDTKIFMLEQNKKVNIKSKN